MFVNHQHRLGIESLQHGDLERSLTLLCQALRENPAHPEILSDRGFLYIHLKNEKAAMEDFDLSLDLQPDYSYRYASRAYAKDFFGDTEGAISDYEQALALNPKDAISYNNLGLLFEKAGITREALKCFEKADSLTKNANEHFDIVEDIAGIQQPIERVVIPPSDLIRKQEDSISTMKKIFTSQEQFQEFMHFLKNGFRTK